MKADSRLYLVSGKKSRISNGPTTIMTSATVRLMAQ